MNELKNERNFAFQEAAREREHLSDEESSKTALTSAPAGGFPDGPSKGSSSFSAEAPSHLRSTVQTLSAENKLLRDRLLQLGVSLDSSPLSDQEKELLLSKVSTISQVSS